jgi:hypothetical protein
MAKASLITVTDNKTVIVEPERIIPAVTRNEAVETTEVTLKLTLAEAEVIQTILACHIAGDDKKSPRKYTDRICDALDAAGVKYDRSHYVLKVHPKWPDILEFQNYPKKTKPVETQPVKLEEPKGIQVGDTIVALKGDDRFFKAGDSGKVVSVNGDCLRVQFENQGERKHQDGRWFIGSDIAAVVRPDQSPKKGDKVVVVDDEGGVALGAVGTVTQVEKSDPWDNTLGTHFLRILWDDPKPYYGGLFSNRVKIVK